MDTLTQVKTIPDPVERVRAINDAIEHGSRLHIELAAIKRETVKEMAAEFGLGETAHRLGISRSRVDQIVNGRRTK